jgi:hypothetical protein
MNRKGILRLSLLLGKKSKLSSFGHRIRRNFFAPAMVSPAPHCPSFSSWPRGMRPDPRRRRQLAGHTIPSARAQADRIKVVVNELAGEGFVERSLLPGSQWATSARLPQPRIHNDNSVEAMVDANRPILGVVHTFEH